MCSACAKEGVRGGCVDLLSARSESRLCGTDKSQALPIVVLCIALERGTPDPSPRFKPTTARTPVPASSRGADRP